MRFKQRDNAYTTYEEIPGEKPTLILIHGWGNNDTLWKPILPSISNHVIHYDVRGHGASERGTEHYTLEALAQDLRDLLTHCDIKNPVLVGQSMGGAIALHYSMNYAVRGVVIIDSTGENVPKHTQLNNVIVKALTNTVSIINPPILNKKKVDLSKGSKDTFALFFKGATNMELRTIIESVAAIHDNETGLHPINTPTLLVRGSRDIVLPAQYNKKLRRLCPNCTPVNIHRSNHNPEIVAPHLVSDLINDFLVRLQTSES